MTKAERIIWCATWLTLLALLVLPILLAPVMREPASHTISATDYFGDE